MSLSISTIDSLTEEGILKCYRVKGKSIKRYKWEDIDDALEKMEMQVNKRFQKSVYDNPQYNGNITSMQWKTASLV